MRTTTINKQKFIVGSELDGFVIKETPNSSNSVLFAVNTIGRQLFVRFKNGGQYLYNNVPDKVIVHAPNVDSITRFINTYLKPIIGPGEDQVTYKKDERIIFTEYCGEPIANQE